MARLNFGLLIFLFCACGGAAGGSLGVPKGDLPARLTVGEKLPSSASLKIRIYVSADYRARVIDWPAQVEAAVAGSSALLNRSSGVDLLLVQSVVWKRSGGPLQKTLDALIAEDAGLDVDVVVALVDATDEVLEQYGDLVASRPSTRHVVIRGFSQRAETAALTGSSEEIGEEAREELLSLLRTHKESVLLVHAIASLFGEPSSMGHRYDRRLNALDVQAARRLRAEVPRQLLMREAAARGRADRKLHRAKDRDRSTLRRIDVERLAQVHLLLEADKPRVAWALLEPLAALYPRNLGVAEAGCQCAGALRAIEVRLRCEAAISLGSRLEAVKLLLAKSLVGIDSRTGAAALE